MELANFIGAGLAVGLAGIGVAMGQGFLSKRSVEIIGKNKEMASFYLTITILGMALVESAVIYGLIIAFQIMGNDSITMSASIGAGLAVGLAGFGAGYGEGKLIGGAITAIDRNPEIKGKIMTLMVLFVALVESAAIYGLVVAFKILGAEDMDSNAFIGMGCAVGFAGLGVSIGEGLLAEKSMEVIGKRQDMTAFFLTLTILGIALVESAAIYGLIVAFQLFAKEGISLGASIGTGLSIGLAGLGAGLGEGILVGGAIKSIDKNPEMKGKIMTLMVLFVALVESAAIYGLVISFKILGMTDFTSMSFIGMGLAVGLAGLGVSIGEGIAAEKSLIAIGKRPEMLGFFLTVTILGIALVESAAIYGLIVAFQLFGTDSISLIAAAGAGLAIGLAGLGAGAGEGILVGGAISAMETNPEAKGKIMTLMVLFVALVESAAIYGLVIAFKIIGMDDFTSMAFLGMGFAIGFAGLGVSIGEGIAAEKSLLAIGRKPDMTGFFLTVTILGIALVESAAIYGLIVAFQLIVKDGISMVAAAGAGLAIGLAGLGAGVGEGILVGGAIKAMEKNPEVKGKIMTLMVLFVALVESAAIYGLVISFKILGMDDFTSMAFLGMGFAIGFAGLGVSIGEGIAAEKSLESIGMRPKMTGFFLTVTILGIALVESAAIYGLIISFQLFGNDTISLAAAAGTGLAIGLAGLGAGVGEGVLVGGAINAMARNPEIKNKLLTLMVLFVALVESAAIYGLVISFNILGLTDTTSTAYTGMGLAIGLAGLGVSIGEGYLAKGSLEVIGKNPKAFGFFLTITILGIALIESAAIYGLIIAFQIGSLDGFSGMLSMTAGFAIGLAGLGAGVGEGLLIKGAIDGMNIAPESRGKTLTLMVLFVALVEVVAIYGLIVAFKVLG
ncbi:MAG: ATP synthase F0 subunit C [Candidatus Gracilibacteria bacterium]|nr:ATP synthase F0 subunit C [Candidatus Gracilibacteria bacterium]